MAGRSLARTTQRASQRPEVHNSSVTVEAENWHFHIALNDVAGIQFVETRTHGERLSYYVRFSGHAEETLLRSYFPNPFLDENYQADAFAGRPAPGIHGYARQIRRQGGHSVCTLRPAI